MKLVRKLRFATAVEALRVLDSATRELSDPERRWLAHKLFSPASPYRLTPLLPMLNYCVLEGKNFNYDLNTNGEAELLRRLAPFAPRVVFDVGANTGDWSLAAAARLPTAMLHAFELVPATCAELRARVAVAPVVVNAFGLSDRGGEITAYAHPDHSERASSIRATFDVGPTQIDTAACATITARVETGDSYMANYGLEKIDFLKIDVEGAEQSVLSGFANAFKNGVIDIVQFEYGAVNLTTRHFLQDFYEFFEQHGFVVGKLYPDGVAFAPYDYKLEDFLGPLFVACRRDRPDLVGAIGRTSQPADAPIY